MIKKKVVNNSPRFGALYRIKREANKSTREIKLQFKNAAAMEQ